MLTSMTSMAVRAVMTDCMCEPTQTHDAQSGGTERE